MAFKKGQGGRPKGASNKASADIKALASSYCPEALKVLLTLMRAPDTPHATRCAAAKEMLDRGCGRPTTTIALDEREFPPIFMLPTAAVMVSPHKEG